MGGRSRAIGNGAVLLGHLRAVGREEEAERIERVGGTDGLGGWGALTCAARRRGDPCPAPNEAAWEHVRVV